MLSKNQSYSIFLFVEFLPPALKVDHSFGLAYAYVSKDTYLCVYLHAVAGVVSNLYITVPLPTVNVTSPDDQTVGQSLTLQCEVTTVRGITSRVDIVWSIDSRVLNTTDGIAPSGSEDSLLYTDGYTISPLSTNDENRTYQCEVMINSNLSVNNNSSVTLDVTGKILR